MDFITGEKFKEIADFIYAPQVKLPGDYDNLRNTFDTALLEDKNVVYTHTMYVKQLFKIIEELPQEFIVITHNSDMNIDNSFSVPDNVIKWFSQNVNVIHEKIESIPIGLENSMWFPEVHKKEKMITKLKQPRNYRNLVYMNFNIGTNPAKRTKPYEILKNKPWVTVDMHNNGYNFDSYLDNIYNHRFVVCPEGNGIDTHRIWESLYMGTVPIVEHNINNSFYEHYLPITLTDEWIDINEVFLKKDLDGFNMLKWLPIADDKMLTFEYWKNKILGYLC